MFVRCECKGCDRRSPGCHSVCESYRAFKAYKAEENILKEKARINTQDIFTVRRFAVNRGFEV